MNQLTENPFASTHSLDTNPFDDPTPYSTTTSSNVKLQDIEQRERDLERREAELNQRADNLRTHGRNNWPPFFPLIFHSIQDEIPEGSRALITRMYQLWMLLAATLILNFVAYLVLLISGATGAVGGFVTSIIFVVLITPLSFFLWYRPIYNAYMKEQALYYYVYFVFGGFHLLFSAYGIIGPQGSGAAGVIQTILAFTGGHIVAGVFCAIAAAGWTVQGLGNALYFRQIWFHRKAAGHTFEKAKGELATHGAKAYFTRG
ncbi:scamp family-domain-containing protein [Irpex rosettiformis]|uniref:Scamp family-domain-containing protein n=1 Tax=Irpex rosettiformis TaxID=378272 RepID=A0ACB8UH49_9APHY|nr:scamp family-domain-containing protein [Irpex rosettiformis]